MNSPSMTSQRFPQKSKEDASIQLVAMLVVLFFALGDPPTSAQDATEEEITELKRQIGIVTAGFPTACQSTLVLEKKRKWMLTCPGCATIPVGGTFPREILDLADQHAVNDRVTAQRLFQAAGTC